MIAEERQMGVKDEMPGMSCVGRRIITLLDVLQDAHGNEDGID